MYAVMNLRATFSPGNVILFVAASLYLMSLRFYVFYMVAFAALGTFLFAQRRGFLGGLVTQIVLVAAFWTPTRAKVMGSVPETSAEGSAVVELCGWTPMCPSTSLS
jgi:hypothetical protein